MVFQRLVAFRDPLEVRVVHRHFLLEDKQEVRLPGAFETPSDLVPRGMNARVTQGGKRLRVTFAREDRADNALSSPPAQVTNDIGELDVHLGQHLLHALDARADGLHVTTTLAPIRTHDTDVGRGVEGIPQEPVRVQLQ